MAASDIALVFSLLIALAATIGFFVVLIQRDKIKNDPQKTKQNTGTLIGLGIAGGIFWILTLVLAITRGSQKPPLTVNAVPYWGGLAGMYR